MILSEKYVFIRNPKTASTSFSASLLRDDGAASAVGATHNILHDMMKGLPDTRAVVVRNPFDRVVSMWFGVGKPDSLLSWITVADVRPIGPGLDVRRVPQIAWANSCNYIMRFENLEEDYEKFCAHVGIDHKPLLYKNKSEQRDGRRYRDVMSSKVREIVEDRFAPDLKRFGYTW